MMEDRHQGGDRSGLQRSQNKKRNSNAFPDVPDPHLDHGDNGPDSHELDDVRGPRRKRRIPTAQEDREEFDDGRGRRKRRNPTAQEESEEFDDGRARRKKRSYPEPYSDHESFDYDSRAPQRSSGKRHARADRHHDDARRGTARLEARRGIERDEYSDGRRNPELSEGRGLQRRSRRGSHPDPYDR